MSNYSDRHAWVCGKNPWKVKTPAGTTSLMKGQKIALFMGTFEYSEGRPERVASARGRGFGGYL